MENFEEKLNKIKYLTAADMDKHIQSSMYLIRNTLEVMEREEALRQIEIMVRTTAELARSYAVLHAVRIRI